MTMKDAKTYRQYAEDCRRIAETMSGRDRAVLLQMAEVWEATAREAERQLGQTNGDKDSKD